MTPPSKKIGRNTLFNLAGKTWLIGLNLAIVPFIIAKLGTEVYGVWALVLVVGNSFAIFDFGISSSIVKYVSQYLALDDAAEVNRIISTGAFFAFSVSLLFCVFAYPLLPWLATGPFQIPLPLLEPALFALKLSLIAFFFGGIFNLFQSILYGAQRMEVVNGIIVAGSILQTLGIVIVLSAGFALKGLIVNHVLFNFILAASMIVATRKAIPSLAIKPWHITKPAFRNLFSYGAKMQVGTATSFLTEHVNKVFVVTFADLSAVTFFDVAMKVINVVRLFPTLLLSALLPSVSEFHALGQRERLQTLYIRGAKYLVAVSVPLVALAVLAAFPAMLLLFGKNFSMAASAIQILAVAYGVNLFTGMGTTFARGIGKPELEMYYALVIAVLNILLVYVLGLWFGYFGVLAGMAAAIMAGSIFFILLFHRVAKKIFGELHENLAKNLFTVVLPAIIAFLVNYVLTALPLARPHYDQFQQGSVIVMFLLLYALVFYKSKFFDAYDRDFLRSMFQWRSR
jgi:O-antigen/teichoic acid export membrane protein